MRINRSLLNWGVFLVALGGVPLAVDQGWLQSDIASDLGRLWPLILVGIGLGLILRWTPLSWFGGVLVAATFGIILGAAAVAIRDDDLANAWGIIPAIAGGACAGGDVGSERSTDTGPAAADAFELSLEFSCGEVDVTRSATADWQLGSAHDPDGAPRIESEVVDGLARSVDLRQERDSDLAFFGRRDPSRWDVELPAEAALTLQLTLNAAEASIDLGAGPLASLGGTLNAAEAAIDLGESTTPETARVDLTLNASEARLLFPAAGRIETAATLNASSLDLCVPGSMALRVELSETISGNDLADSGLEESAPATWTTPGFSTAGDHVHLEIGSTVSSLSLERPEACA